MPVFHIVMIKWKPGTSDERIAERMRALGALKDQIPGIISVHTGVNFSDRAKGYTHAGIVQLKDREALANYGPHPAHRALGEPFREIAEDLMVVDFGGEAK